MSKRGLFCLTTEEASFVYSKCIWLFGEWVQLLVSLAGLLVNFEVLLVSFAHLLVNFAVLLVSLAQLLVNFAVLLVNFENLTLSL
ncbi:hypothetical protein [Peribacillus frigoritolerans]|uniref:hypothetical protein n=1 Tax=Peribacillus frigoritolerans TaxID=450367 RepID=UPI000FDA2121|nr:hypothetical protein [Peribacillus frigoritolerans]AZV62838.1 hypothetical protein DOZ91_21420 [Peribacillus frigoritolerans]